MSHTNRWSKQTTKFWKITKQGKRIKIQKWETMQWQRRIPKNINVGEFTFIETYNDAHLALTFGDLVTFKTITSPFGVMIRSISKYPELEVSYTDFTEHKAFRGITELLLSIIIKKQNEKKNA